MVYIQLPASLSSRYFAVRAMTALCRALHQPLEFTDAVVSAVGEAFNNAVLHAHAPFAEDPTDTVDIEVEVTGDAIQVRVMDHGAGFSLEEVPALDIDSLAIDNLPENGMGLHIIRALMSEVNYVQGQPNVLCMRKELAQPA